MEKLEELMPALSERFDRTDQIMKEGFDKIEVRFDKVEDKLNKIRKHLRNKPIDF